MGKVQAAALAVFAAVMTTALLAGCGSSEQTTLRVMSFNVWGAGANESKPVDETVAAIKAAGADVIGVQETRVEGPKCTASHCPPLGRSVARKLARRLGFNYYDQTGSNPALWANAVLSRYPIVGETPNDLGVELDVDGRSVYAFNIHLDDSPYQPYQLLDIPYGNAPFIDTETEAIRFARRTRGPAVRLFHRDLRAADDADAAFVFGDFNEPSWHDWTKAAVRAGNQPIAVRWPTTRAIEASGFVDAYREANPDPVAKPAFTWTPTSKPTVSWDHHDRIDFIFARADDLEVQSAAIVGEQRPEAAIVVRPWPSDHRSVVATVSF
ncbi:MAG: endonuclease/exonuclease/phosphatase family protein [Solirubrobacterales bacterium]